MRVFLDTNVLVSAFATRGLCADIVRHVLTDHELVTSKLVLTELERALSDKIRLPEPDVREILELFHEFQITREPSAPPSLGLRDRADEAIAASALAAKADIMVTGDKDILEARDLIDLPVVDPRAFWNLLRSI